ncbi:MAG: GNAT family N-acetyltransferase [Thermogemmata sp.]
MKYHKRYMMECALSEEPGWEVRLPPGYVWVPWSDAVVERHAAVLYESFRDSRDATILPSLGTVTGCLVLVRTLARWRGFCPAANWLIAYQNSQDVACLQAALDIRDHGVIINLAVLSPHRGQGLGTALLRRGLQGLYQAGARRVYLEVTASNQAALNLYRRHHFRCYKTLYREAIAGEGAACKPGTGCSGAADREAAPAEAGEPSFPPATSN